MDCEDKYFIILWQRSTEFILTVKLVALDITKKKWNVKY